MWLVWSGIPKHLTADAVGCFTKLKLFRCKFKPALSSPHRIKSEAWVVWNIIVRRSRDKGGWMFRDSC